MAKKLAKKSSLKKSKSSHKGAKKSASLGSKSTKIFSLTLPRVADITFVNDLHAQLTKAVKKHAMITVDASAVERLTSPCAQALISLSKLLKAKNGKLTVSNPSPSVEEAFSILGLSQQLDEWRAA